jgi:hypothetical protein
MAMSAREYFYTVLAPEQAGRTYQEVQASAIERQMEIDSVPQDERKRIRKRLRRHAANRSNDFLIEEYMRALVASGPVALRPRLKKMFVAKVRDFNANAAAICDSGQYEGDLVFFNVGLSDVCLQYAILYYEFIRLIGEIQPNADSHVIADLIKKVGDHSLRLARAQARWDRLDAIRLTPDDVVESSADIESYAVSVAASADQFILCHEVAHHILGHTQLSTALFSWLDELPDGCRYWKTTNRVAHSREYQADASAVMLRLLNRSDDASRERRRDLEVSIGTLLTMTVLGQLVPDVTVSTHTHPSVSSRFRQCVDILRTACTYELAIGQVIEDFGRFHSLLWMTQGKGLGRLRGAADAPPL